MQDIYKRNIEYIEKRLSKRYDELMDFPVFFQIETINNCNARCAMCPVIFTKRRKGKISNELFGKIVSEIEPYADRIEQVAVFLDGEPLLDKELDKKIRVLKDIGIKTVLVASNGSLLNEENILKLLEAKLDKIFVSIDGYSRDTFEDIRKGLRFQDVVTNAKRLIRLRDESKSNLRVRLQFILQKRNIGEVEQWRKYWQEFITPRDEIKVIKVTNWGCQLDIHDFDIKGNNHPCVSPFGTMIIQNDGRASLCCADYDCKILMGDLNENSIKEIWHGEEFKRVRQDFLNSAVKIPMCKNCNIWREDKYYEI